MQLTSIAQWEVPLHWARMAPLLTRVLARDEADNSLEDVHQLLLTGSMQAWHYDWRMLVVTQLQNFGADPAKPTRKVCNITFCAGEGLDEWLTDSLGRIEEWARSLGYTRIRIVGRRGWARKLPGYRETAITLEKQS